MITRLTLGANRFNLLSQYQVDQLLSSALELGVSHIDTAPTYLTSEDKVGNFLRRNQGAFNVTTKIFRNQEQINEIKLLKKALYILLNKKLRSKYTKTINLSKKVNNEPMPMNNDIDDVNNHNQQSYIKETIYEYYNMNFLKSFMKADTLLI
jgi:diketogulonate reductase-like aldo/keto reductase